MRVCESRLVSFHEVTVIDGLIDCNGGCVGADTANSYIGDAYCDDGQFGFFLNCAEFEFDGGDCNGRNNNDTHRGKKPSSIVSSSNSSVFVDAATGVITYGENYEPNRDVSYSVTMSCTWMRC